MGGIIMSRSVILNDTRRCERCRLPPRWCICEGLCEIDSELKVDVLIHDREALKPTSTGHMIKRVMKDAGLHRYLPGRPLDKEAILVPGRELWILHPNGEELPPAKPASQVQVLLLDGSWKQATDMAKAVAGWGRKVRLPMTGESRYWLRNQQGPGQFSTAEALLFLMKALGMTGTWEAFRLQFELQVYSGLCVRGAKADAQEFIKDSPLADAMPALVAKLSHCRKDIPAWVRLGKLHDEKAPPPVGPAGADECKLG
jgi:DTW domain-containing protein YfiP